MFSIRNKKHNKPGYLDLQKCIHELYINVQCKGSRDIGCGKKRSRSHRAMPIQSRPNRECACSVAPPYRVDNSAPMTIARNLAVLITACVWLNRTHFISVIMFANRNELSGLGENDPILDVGIVILDCILFVVELKLEKCILYECQIDYRDKFNRRVNDISITICLNRTISLVYLIKLNLLRNFFYYLVASLYL